MAQPILPTADQVVTPAIDAIVALRPEALQHFNSAGAWTHLSTAWRAQAVVALSRLAAEVKAARLRFAKGDELRALCASEFQTVLPVSPQLSFATVTLSRLPPQVGLAPPGVIRSITALGTGGTPTKFSKVANPDGIPQPAANAYPLAIQAAQYDVVAPVYIAPGQLTATVQLVATSPGVAGNVPSFTNYPTPLLIQPSKPLFDPTFQVTGCSGAGGSSGLPDPVLVAAARAHAIGQFGPTQGAVIAGALEQQSVRHYAVFPANSFVPYEQLYVADESWGSNAIWTSRVAQHIADNWQGFGCRSRVGSVTNQHIALSATIVLVSTDALNYTDFIDINVRAAAESYFNDRPDWYTWRLSALRAVLSKADPRILYCSNVVVTDAVTQQVLSEPQLPIPGSLVWQLSWSPTITHFALLDQSIVTQYAPPN